SQPGWTVVFSQASLTIAPGATATATMTENVAATAAPGTYAVNASAASGTVTSSATASLTVLASPTLAITVSTSGSTFSQTSSITISAKVSLGNAPPIQWDGLTRERNAPDWRPLSSVICVLIGGRSECATSSRVCRVYRNDFR